MNIKNVILIAALSFIASGCSSIRQAANLADMRGIMRALFIEDGLNCND